MFRRALLPLDGSAFSDRIVRFALALLDDGASLQLLQVAVDEGRLDEARAHLDRVRATLEPAALTVTTEVARGDPAQVILAAAERLEPDVIIMATHGRSGPARWFRGSVAEQVARHAAAPALIANPGALERTPALRPRRILVPIDGSPEALATLPQVERLARASGAEVLLLTVGEPLPPLAASGGAAILPAPVTPSLEALETILEAPLRALRQVGLRARALVAWGPVATELLVVAEREEVDLLVLTTHARSGLERWVLGSTTEEVLRHGRRPALVLRAHAPAAAR